MSISIQKYRELVFQFLYSRAFGEGDFEMLIPLMMRQHAISRKSASEIAAEAGRIWIKAAEFDQRIEKHALDFSLEKIGRVERALILQAIFALDLGEVPFKVVISEAIRLSKKFSTPESGAFVNALLDAIYKEGESASVIQEKSESL